MAKSIQRGAYCMLILANILRTSDANRVSYSPTCAQFVVITGLLNIELLGLQEAYLREMRMKVNSEWEAARNESLVGIRVMEMSLAIVRFPGGITHRGKDEGDFRTGGY
jgi:hypothetical protein